MSDAFKAAGFKAGKISERDGVRSINYRKDGQVMVVVSVKPAADGGSELRFGWRL